MAQPRARFWVPYAGVWVVCTNGRYVASEREALEEEKEILDQRG